MIKNIKKHFYVWSSDCFSNTGEGKLAILYLRSLYRYNDDSKIEVETPYNKFIVNKNCNFLISKKLNYNFYIKYITPILGIFKLWINYFKKKKIIYLNYLPLWNSFIFFLSPPGTIFGPITGGIYKKKIMNINYFLRRFVFPLIYKINIKILFFRKKKILFSTSLLRNFIPKKKLHKCIFDFQILYLYKKKINNNRKSKSLLIYFRKHSNKNYNFQTEIIKSFHKSNIFIFGDYYNSKLVKNFGTISTIKLKNLLKKSKYVVAGLENYASFFLLDCYLNNIGLIENSKMVSESKIVNFKAKKLPFNSQQKYYQILIDKKSLINLRKQVKNYLVKFN